MPFRGPIRTFADETGIFGLHFFTRQRSTFEVIFWCAFVAIFACYTTKCIVDITAKFVAEETLTSVYEKSRDVIYFPDPMVCVYGGPISSMAKSRDVTPETILAEFAEKFDLNGSIFQHAAGIVRHGYELELSVISQAQFSDLKRIQAKISVIQSSALRVSKPSLFTNLSDFVFIKLCEALQLSLSFKNHSLETQGVPLACRRENIFFPSDADERAQTSICVKLDKDLFVFRSGVDRVDVTLGFSSASLRETVGLDAASTHVYFVANGHYHMSGGAIRDYDSVVELHAHTHRRYYVRLNALYENLDLRRRRCEPDRTRSTFCRAQCESRFFYDCYGCWPSVFVAHFEKNLTTIRRCEAIDYLKNHTQIVRDPVALQRLVECRAECFEPCARPIFSISGDNAQASQTTIARIYVQSHVYTHVDERLANDFESFLASLGGAMGLWLGASLGSIIHIPIFLVQLIIGAYRSKNESGKADFSAHLINESDAILALAQKLEAHEKLLLELQAAQTAERFVADAASAIQPQSA